MIAPDRSLGYVGDSFQSKRTDTSRNPAGPGAAGGGVSDNAGCSKSAPATPSAGGPKATFRSSRVIPKVSGGAT
jgi:hypothetical protein